MLFTNLTIIAVDDHLLYLTGLKEFLGQNLPGSTIRVFRDYDSVIVAINEAVPLTVYVAVIDGKIGDRKGYELIKPLKEAFPTIYIISHSGKDELNAAALEFGADYACSKGTEEGNLILAIKRIHKKNSEH